MMNNKINKFDIKTALDKLEFSNKKFSETIEAQFSFFSTSSNLGKSKKNKFIIPIKFNKVSGRGYSTVLISNSLEAEKNVNVNEFLTDIKKYISRDKILCSSDCIGKLNSNVLKKMGQKGLTPKEELLTSSTNINTLVNNQKNFEDGILKHIVFKIDKKGSIMHVPMGKNKEDALQNFEVIMNFINNDALEMLELKKTLMVKTLFIKSTMGKPIKVNKL